MPTAKPRESLKRRDREKAAHRREILEAAERVFAQKGFDRATVENIAREAEFSVGALYNFFQNKEDLWAEVIAKIGEDFLEAFRKEIGAVDDPLAAITAMIEVRLRYAQEHDAFLRVFMETKPVSQVSPAAAIPRNCRGIYNAYLADAAALFKAAMAAGRLRKADATYTALSLEGVISAFRAYWLRQGIALSVAGQASLVRRHFLIPLGVRTGAK
jgi:AcrR family transcriptional regulator